MVGQLQGGSTKAGRPSKGTLLILDIQKAEPRRRAREKGREWGQVYSLWVYTISALFPPTKSYHLAHIQL